MKKENISDALNMLDDNMIEHAGMAREKNRQPKSAKWGKWCGIAACLCLVCAIAAIAPLVFKSADRQPEDAVLSKREDTQPEDAVLSKREDTQPEDAALSEQEDTQQVTSENFVSAASLLAKSDAVEDQAALYAKIPIGQYTGIYTKVSSVGSDTLLQSIGKNIPGTETCYYISGHTDLQYLIQDDGQAYSLWKFQCFDSDGYPYSDVLELVYQVNSADVIAELEVKPPTMDNTDNGKKIQERIGTRKITDRDAIEKVYRVLSSLTCYGEDHWDMIDYGNVEADAATGTVSGNPVWLGRYLSLKTSYGNEIDGLKYTAVSDMFYEFAGIAYEPLPKEQADIICEILGIDMPSGENQPE